MIIETAKTTVVTNMPVGTVTEMGITKKGMARLMMSLTNLYNDPMMAVVREYFANALDSHVKAGQTAPVEVSLPDYYNKMFIVQDFGTGMSVDDIQNIYSQYGESTKDEDNDQIGAFGLGAKSALAIANQFTLVTIKDGVKATVLVQKAESGINTMSVISVLDTEDSNGVTVSIPVSDPYAFNNKAKNFFQFVDSELVLVDGGHPVSVFSTATKLETEDDSVEAFVDMSRSYGTSYVVMGQVAYALTSENISDAAHRLDLDIRHTLSDMPVYFRVPIGSVELTPNREGLRYTDKTIATFDRLVSAYLTTIEKTAQEEIDAIDDRFKVAPVVAHWEDRIGRKLKWRGETVISDVRTASPSSTIQRSWNGASTHGSSYSISVTPGTQRVIVTGNPHDRYKRISNYITDYLDMQGLGHQTKFYFREALDELDTAWITENPDFLFEDFDDMIKRVKEHRKELRAAARANLPKELRDRPAKLEYPVLDVDTAKTASTPYDQIPSDAFYLDAEELKNHLDIRDGFNGKNRYSAVSLAEKIKLLVGDGASVVFIAKGRSVESFKARIKDSSNLRNLKDLAPEIQDRINALMTDKAVRRSGRYLLRNANRKLQGLDGKWIAQIIDEELRELITPLTPEMEQARDEASSLSSYFNSLFPGTKVEKPSYEYEDEPDFGTTYPLLEIINTYGLGDDVQEHIVRYINMVYSENLTLVDA